MAKLVNLVDIHPIQGAEISNLYEGLMFNTRQFNPDFNLGSVIVVGPSGGGKEARGAFIAAQHGKHRLESGEIFRGLAKKAGSDARSVILEFAQDYDRDGLETAVHDLGFIGSKLSGRLPHLAVEDIATLISMYKGLFVPDFLAIPRFQEQIKSYTGPVVLDGHIRSKRQASDMAAFLLHRHTPVAGVLLVHADLPALEERLTGRRACTDKEHGCKAGYNLTVTDFTDRRYVHEPFVGKGDYMTGYCSNPVHKGQQVELERRDDDKPAEVNNRLQQYRDHTIPALHELQRQGLPIWVVTGQLKQFTPEAIEQSVRGAMYCGRQPLIELGLEARTPERVKLEEARFTPTLRTV